MYNKILGVLYGMAMGDAMGMPPELWSRERLKRVYGTITDFLDGNPDNIISYQYVKGNYTDDTSQALAILDSLIETDFVPMPSNIAGHILSWARSCNAEENNILGPTSKQALALIEKGEDPRSVTSQAFSNGAAMRIPPIGVLFSPEEGRLLCNYVAKVSCATHASGITIAGASMIAMAVSCAVSGKSREEMIHYVTDIEAYARTLGNDLAAPSLSRRIHYGLELSEQYLSDDDLFLENLYQMMGAGVNTADSIPCAVVISYRAWGHPRQCALLCANLGGDTDTIGAMATAACGGVYGVSTFTPDDMRLLETSNHISFDKYAKELTARRGTICPSVV